MAEIEKNILVPCVMMVVKEQAGRRLVRSLLTVCDIGVSLHPWAYVDNK